MSLDARDAPMRFPRTRTLLGLGAIWFAAIFFLELVVRPREPLTAAFLFIFLLAAPPAYVLAESVASYLPEWSSAESGLDKNRRAARTKEIVIGVLLFAAADAALVGLVWYFS